MPNIFRKLFLVMTTLSIIGNVSCGVIRDLFDDPVTVLRDERKLHKSNNGEYSFLVELSDGTFLEQRGFLSKAASTAPSAANDTGEEFVEIMKNLESGSLSVTGRYSFVDPVTGIRHQVEYIADEKGYRPKISKVPSPEQAPQRKKADIVADEGKMFGEKLTFKSPATNIPSNSGNMESLTNDDANRNSSETPMLVENLESVTVKTMAQRSTEGENHVLEKDLGGEEGAIEAVTTPLPPLETIAASLFSSPEFE